MDKKNQELEEVEQVMAFSRAHSGLSEEQLRQLDDTIFARFKTYVENDDLRILSDDGKRFTFEEGDPHINILAYFKFKSFSFPIKKSEWIHRNDEIADLLHAHSSFSEKLMVLDYETQKELKLDSYRVYNDGYTPSRFNEEQLELIEKNSREQRSLKAYNPKPVLDDLIEKVEDDEVLAFLASFERPEPDDVQYLVAFEYRVKFYEYSNDCPKPTETLRFFLDALITKYSEEPPVSLQETIDYFESSLVHMEVPRGYSWDVFVSDRKRPEENAIEYAFYDFTTLKEDSHATA